MGEGEPMYEDGFGGYEGCPACEDGTCSLHVGPGYRRAMQPTGPRSRAYAHGEYLLWWIDGMNVPPLVTTSTDPADGGVLPNPGLNDNQTTSILYGEDPILEDRAARLPRALGCLGRRVQQAGHRRRLSHAR